MRDLAFGSIWLVLLPASFFAPYVGVLLWAWIALLSPNELLYGPLASVPFNKIIAVATLLVVFTSREKKDFYFDKTSGALLLLAIVGTISWANALTSTPLTDDLYLKLIKEIILAFTIMLVVSTRSRLHLLVFVVAISIGFVGVKEGLIFALTAGGHKVLGTGAIGDNNSVAAALLMVAPLMYYLHRYSAVRLVRIGMMAALVLSILAVVATASRGGFLGLVVLGLFAVKNSRNKAGGVLLVVTAAIVIYFSAPDAWFNRVSTIESADSDGSFLGRVIAWKMSWLIAMDRPLFGGGFHAVQQWPVWSAYVPRLGELDFIQTPLLLDGNPHAAHSVWFEILGDLGFVGLAVFIAMLGMATWDTARISRRARRDPALAWAADLARMLQISVATYVVTASALSMGYFELVYVLVAIISRLRRLADQSETAPAATAISGRPSRAIARVGVPA